MVRLKLFTKFDVNISSGSRSAVFGGCGEKISESSGVYKEANNSGNFNKYLTLFLDEILVTVGGILALFPGP